MYCMVTPGAAALCFSMTCTISATKCLFRDENVNSAQCSRTCFHSKVNILYCTCNQTQIDKKKSIDPHVSKGNDTQQKKKNNDQLKMYIWLLLNLQQFNGCVCCMQQDTPQLCVSGYRGPGAHTTEKESGNKVGRLHHSSGALRHSGRSWKHKRLIWAFLILNWVSQNKQSLAEPRRGNWVNRARATKRC